MVIVIGNNSVFFLCGKEIFSHCKQKLAASLSLSLTKIINCSIYNFFMVVCLRFAHIYRNGTCTQFHNRNRYRKNADVNMVYLQFQCSAHFSFRQGDCASQMNLKDCKMLTLRICSLCLVPLCLTIKRSLKVISKLWLL